MKCIQLKPCELFKGSDESMVIVWLSFFETRSRPLTMELDWYKVILFYRAGKQECISTVSKPVSYTHLTLPTNREV